MTINLTPPLETTANHSGLSTDTLRSFPGFASTTESDALAIVDALAAFARLVVEACMHQSMNDEHAAYSLEQGLQQAQPAA